MSYAGALQALASKGGAPAPPASMGSGPPPQMPDLPPPTTNTGAMPTGSLGTNRKTAIDNAVLALREVSGHVPAAQPQIETLIATLKSAAQPPPAPPVGEPSPPGSEPPPVPPTETSGSGGAF